MQFSKQMPISNKAMTVLTRELKSYKPKAVYILWSKRQGEFNNLGTQNREDLYWNLNVERIIRKTLYNITRRITYICTHFNSCIIS